MLRRPLALAALALAMLLGRGAPALGADLTLTIDVDGVQRTAFLHAPDVIDPARRYPLVIGFHGGAGNAEGYIENSQLFDKGEAGGSSSSARKARRSPRHGRAITASGTRGRSTSSPAAAPTMSRSPA